MQYSSKALLFTGLWVLIWNSLSTVQIPHTWSIIPQWKQDLVPKSFIIYHSIGITLLSCYWVPARIEGPFQTPAGLQEYLLWPFVKTFDVKKSSSCSTETSSCVTVLPASSRTSGPSESCKQPGLARVMTVQIYVERVAKDLSEAAKDLPKTIDCELDTTSAALPIAQGHCRNLHERNWCSSSKAAALMVFTHGYTTGGMEASIKRSNSKRVKPSTREFIGSEPRSNVITLQKHRIRTQWVTYFLTIQAFAHLEIPKKKPHEQVSYDQCLLFPLTRRRDHKRYHA